MTPILPIIKNNTEPPQQYNTTKTSSLPRVQLKNSLLEKIKAKRWERKQLPTKRYNLRSRPKESDTYMPAAQHIFTPNINHIYNPEGKRLTMADLLAGETAETWNKSMSMELGRLAQGNKYGVESTDTIDIILKTDVPVNEKVTYAQCVCDFRPLKPEPHRVRIVVGSNKLDCDIDSGAPTTNLTEFKILANSTISEADKGARFISCDIKDFFWHLR